VKTGERGKAGQSVQFRAGAWRGAAAVALACGRHSVCQLGTALASLVVLPRLMPQRAC